MIPKKATITRLINVIYRTGAMYRADSSKEKALDLNPAHFFYIGTLHRHPGISQDEIARRLCLDKSNVTRHLSVLESKGIVERRQSEVDRRVINVYPTEKLEELFPRVREVLREWNEYLIKDLEPEEVEILTGLLLKVAQSAAKYAERDFDKGEGVE